MRRTTCPFLNRADKSCLHPARVNYDSRHNRRLLRCIDAELHVVVETEKSKGRKDQVWWKTCIDWRKAPYKDWAHLRRVDLVEKHYSRSPCYCIWQD